LRLICGQTFAVPFNPNDAAHSGGRDPLLNAITSDDITVFRELVEEPQSRSQSMNNRFILKPNRTEFEAVAIVRARQIFRDVMAATLDSGANEPLQSSTDALATGNSRTWHLCGLRENPGGRIARTTMEGWNRCSPCDRRV
jgi:hypothetical protein